MRQCTATMRRTGKRRGLGFGVAGWFVLAAPAWSQTILTDEEGDAAGNSDCVMVIAGIARSNVTLTAIFVPGSFDRTQLGFIFGFDLDQNPTTGVAAPAVFPLGAESGCYFDSASDSNHASIFDNGTQQLVGVPVEFGSDFLKLSFPQVFLADPDGAMYFGFICGVPLGTNGFIPYDTVPDSAFGGPLTNAVAMYPELQIMRLGSNTTLRWSAQASNHVLEATTQPSLPNSWFLITNQLQIIGDEIVVTDSAQSSNRLYRLKR